VAGPLGKRGRRGEEAIGMSDIGGGGENPEGPSSGQ